jgi:RNA polymerase sigma-70 factor (ECF subfamily)
VRAFCARSCGKEQGDDVAQDVFVALLQATRHYLPDGRFRGFLFTIAARRCQNALRGARVRREDLVSVERAKEDAESSLDEVLSEERRRRLFGLVGELPEAQRSAIHMRFSAGLDYAAVACAMGCSEPTARTRVHLGLGKLRAICAKRGDL